MPTGQYIRKRKPAIERFIDKIAVQPNGCWLWSGCLVDGYGRLRVDGNYILAHRFSYEYHVGLIPAELILDHQCHNKDLTCLGGSSCLHRRCVNPEHLEPATRRDNTNRGRTITVAGLFNKAKTHCPSGHEYTTENTAIYKGMRFCRECGRAQKSSRRLLMRQSP